jgi:hypothetical protein
MNNSNIYGSCHIPYWHFRGFNGSSDIWPMLLQIPAAVTHQKGASLPKN